jgi:hypothetical protein
MPITAKCIISKVGIPLKVIFRGSQLKQIKQKCHLFCIIIRQMDLRKKQDGV